LNDLTDVNSPAPSNGQVLQFNGSEWIPAAPAGGGDMLAANNLSDVANAATSLSNLGGEPTITAGTAAQYLKGDKTLGTFATDVAATAAVTTNSGKVSADGSVATHSDVDLSGIAAGNVLQWNGANFAPVSLPGGGDMLGANNLSDVANAATALSNLGGEPALASGTAAQYFKGDKTLGTFATDVAATASVAANTAKVSADGSVSTHSDVILTGITDGQILKWNNSNSRFEPANETGGGGGSGVGEEHRVQLGAGASIADKIAAAPVGGIPAGWTILDGDDGGVDAQLSGNDQDLILQHDTGKVGIIVGAVSVGGFGGWQSLDFSAAGGLKTEDNTENQTRIQGFNTAAGSTASIIVIKLIDILP
jgi:hypothetical protein